MIDNEELLKQLAELDLSVRKTCDLIPIQHWGFDDSVRERLNQRKYRVVAQNLRKDVKQVMSNKGKHKLAKKLGIVPSTVCEIIGWMASDDMFKDTKAHKAKQQPAAEKQKTQTPQTAKSVPVQQVSVESDSDSEQDSDVKHGDVSMSSQPIDEPDETDEEGETVDEDEDDEEEEEKFEKVPEPEVPKGKFGGKHIQKRKEPEASVQPVAKKPKLDRDLPLDPLEARRIAMEKLQAKIGKLKALRRGEKSASDFESARKMKKRMRKLQIKQQTASQKPVQVVETLGEQTEPIEPIEQKTLDTQKALASGDAMVNGVTYSKFDFIVREPKQKLSKKQKRDKFTGKDFKRLLEKAEKRKERIESIREKNPEKAQKIEESIKWNKIIQQAEGQKVRDNVDMLKKAAKRKEKTKERSKRKWDDRQKNIESKQSQKQDKRQSNIEKRKDVVKKRKMDKLRKKGRIL